MCSSDLWVIGANTMDKSPLFQCGWFVFGTVSQVLVIYMIRTAKIPFLQSKPSAPLFLSTLVITTAALITGFTDFSIGLDMYRLPPRFVVWLAIILAGYLLCVQLVKKIYVHRHGEWM